MDLNQDMARYSTALGNVPEIKANKDLEGFRREVGLSWHYFNILWADVCHYINSPANEVLLNPGVQETDIYDQNLFGLTSHLLGSGTFGLDRRGTWIYGRYRSETDRPA